MTGNICAFSETGEDLEEKSEALYTVVAEKKQDEL